MKQQPPHLPIDVLLRMRAQGQVEEDLGSRPIEEQPDDFIEVPEARRGSAKTERRPSVMPASLDSELILSAFKDINAISSGGPRSPSRVNFLTAAEWLLGRDSDRLFSFVSVCDRLELDARYIARETLRRLPPRRTELIRKHFERFGIEWLVGAPAPLPDECPTVQSIPSRAVPPEALEPEALPKAA